MKKPKAKLEKLNLHGYDIEYTNDNIAVFMREETIEADYQFIAKRLASYLVLEGFIEKKPYNIDIKVYEK